MKAIELPAPFAHYDWIDGVKQRKVFYCYSPLEDTQNVLVICVGRRETGLKYAQLAQLFVNNGWSVVAIDHRGQGFSERLCNDPELGHVEDFSFYIEDLKLLFNRLHLEQFGYRALLGHSLGGAIGTLYLDQYPQDFHRALLLSPMFGIITDPVPRWQAKVWIKRLCRKDKRLASPSFAPGQHRYEVTPFAENLLTQDQDNYQQQLAQFEYYPALKLGGPSNCWIAECFHAMAEIARLKALPIPVKVIAAEFDQIVDHQAQLRFVRRQKRLGAQISYSWQTGAFHELLQEKKPICCEVIGQIKQFFNLSPIDG
ncbi:alpha/beta fold hydrolase [Celerinatantimonas diazotrophica]|uniref:Lysophospholipase n=1 Tax=Celerinatantimonas diazotrophica TaxID=412034 RepID=A0A4R1J7B2_9GAMM|nr:alpha/beta fold hydrolase [Celerinatantimonas diazotrophica]TCK46325.1 lysophospholipase [Celerinatantimonas diazotrophica]CAG9295301.1 Lysophospholipase L2 [Celerinatantimonas diazotrophica]